MGKRRHGGHELPDAEDVLSGRTHADARTLLRMINVVNPTGRAVADRDRTQRYQMKSRLQSLLVRDHADVLEVRPDPQHDGLVTIRHIVLGDASHAMVAELEDDARSWVQLQLDLATWDERHRG